MDSAGIVRPWMVVVKGDRVACSFPWVSSLEELRRLLITDLELVPYCIDLGMGPPPPAGTPVDPLALRWVGVGQRHLQVPSSARATACGPTASSAPHRSAHDHPDPPGDGPSKASPSAAIGIPNHPPHHLEAP